MNHGYIRVGAATPQVKVADCPYNMDSILSSIAAAREKQVKILVFPELSITSYTCGDLFQQQALLDSGEEQLKRLVEYTQGLDMVVVVGLPVRCDQQIFNCAVMLSGGRILGVVPKTFIPGHSEFYEERWFASSVNSLSSSVTLGGQEVPFGGDLLFQCTEYPDLCIGIEVSEDLWMPIPPSASQCLHGATLILNPSASNETVGKHEYRRALVQQQSARCMAGYVYASAGQGESTTDMVFSGHSMIGENGVILAESERFSAPPQLVFSEVDIDRLVSDRRKNTSFMDLMGSSMFQRQEYRIVPFHLKPHPTPRLSRFIAPYPFVPEDQEERDARCEEIFAMQIAGLAKRMAHTKASTAVLGVSGGLDSTLALLVSIGTFDKLGLDRKNILGITMPGFGTSDRTYQNSVQLVKSLGASLREISIRDACLLHFQDIGHNPDVLDATYENTQARERTQILMNIANQTNGLMIGPGDLSELALGWTTYNGDHMSMYAVNVGVPKTLVRHLVAWAADRMAEPSVKATLLDILDTPVSPELLPAANNGDIEQRTEDIIGPYELHDFFLYYMVRFGFRPAKIFFLACHAFRNVYSDESILKWLKVFYRRFFTHQFKRSCLPDGPKVGSVNLSPRSDWKMPSDASYRIWMEELDALQL
ncbi:MAG: NAD(+) synthase [Clostridia bacterium]|jgi:NAD+ synthase (glutamine-hydrolysing)